MQEKSHFTCYLPPRVLKQLDERLAEGPAHNEGRKSRSGIVTLAVERYLGERKLTVRDVFEEALGPRR